MNDWTDAERRAERAQELFRQRRWKQALVELEAATSINPHQAAWFAQIGMAWDELGRFDEAVLAYQQALSLEPDDLSTLSHLGVDFHRLGRHADALKAFERI